MIAVGHMDSKALEIILRDRDIDLDLAEGCAYFAGVVRSLAPRLQHHTLAAAMCAVYTLLPESDGAITATLLALGAEETGEYARRGGTPWCGWMLPDGSRVRVREAYGDCEDVPPACTCGACGWCDDKATPVGRPCPDTGESEIEWLYPCQIERLAQIDDIANDEEVR